MRIGLDVDGVMYQWDKTARYMLRDVLPDSPYTKDGPLGVESKNWHYIKEQVSREHYNWLWNEGVKLGLFRHGHMYPGTIQAVRALAKLGDIVIITHRPDKAVRDTLAWLAYHELPLSEIHILSNQEPKSQVRVDFFLDDKPENCVDMRQNGGEVFLMSRPWNKAWRIPEGSGIGIVSGWEPFVDFVRDSR